LQQTLLQASFKQAIASHDMYAHSQLLTRSLTGWYLWHLMTSVVFIDWLDGTVRMRTPKFLPLNDWVLRCSRVLSWTWGPKVGFPFGSHEGSCKTQRHGQHIIADRQPDTYNNW
jgi:hypothetical protein